MLVGERGLYYVSDDNNNKFVIRPSIELNSFNVFFEVPIESGIGIDEVLTEGFERLARLFDNSIVESNTSVICPTDGVLKYGTDNNGGKLFVIDPVIINKKPIIYSNLNVKLFIETGDMIKQGQVILKGENDLSNYDEYMDLIVFLIIFVGIIQGIYESQGVIVNSKHIEMVLRQMTNTINVSDPGDSPLKAGCDYTWQEVARINHYINIFGGRLISGERQVVGVTEACTNQRSILSAILLPRRVIRIMIKAIISGNNYNIIGIKDRVMLGRVLLVGMGSKQTKVDWKGGWLSRIRY